jgi:hypothetical protein
MSLPTDAKERKEIPVYSGVIRYFPDALAAVARLSKRGNDQHNPGAPLHWDRTKSGDELDAMMRHVLDEDWDAVAWRALAHLQKHIEKIENENPKKIAPGNWHELAVGEKRYIKEAATNSVIAEPIEGNNGYYNIKDLTGRIVCSLSASNERAALESYRKRL